jgi:hypothetical protein
MEYKLPIVNDETAPLLAGGAPNRSDNSVRPQVAAVVRSANVFWGCTVGYKN